MLDKTALLSSMKGFLIETLSVLLLFPFSRNVCFRKHIKMKKVLQTFQYFVMSPLASMTAWTCLGIEWVSLLR